MALADGIVAAVTDARDPRPGMGSCVASMPGNFRMEHMASDIVQSALFCAADSLAGKLALAACRMSRKF